MSDPDNQVKQAIEAYILLRNKKDEEKKVFQQRVEAIDMAMSQLETYLLAFLQQAGGDSIKTAAGTAYISDRITYSVIDREALKNYVVQTQSFDLLEMRVAKEAVDDFIEAKDGELPPGVKMSAFRKVNVRQS